MTTEITADDVAALRKAEAVTLHFSVHGSFLRAYLRSHTGTFSRSEQIIFPQAGITPSERVRTILCTSSASGHTVPGITESWSYQPGSDRTVPACFYTMYDDETRRSIAATLRTGDTLHLSWTADNNNDAVRTASLHVDMVHLRVNPNTPKARKYLIGYQVGPDNSARMVRRVATTY